MDFVQASVCLMAMGCDCKKIATRTKQPVAYGHSYSGKELPIVKW